MNKKLGLVVKEDPKAIETCNTIKAYLGDRCRVIDISGEPDSATMQDLYCIVVLGGDGTFLSAARYTLDFDLPLMGIKFGEVGFLAETLEDEIISAVNAILEERYTVEYRTRLQVSVKNNNKTRIRVDVLNDAVINKSALSRLAYCDVYIDQYYLTTYKADGLIVGTPTGSTAYSLAAGGPVIHPAVPGIILTPICPFTLTNRPLILPDSVGIEIRIKGNPTDTFLTFDGQEGLDVDSSDRIFITKSQTPLKMVCLNEQNYFSVLKARLMWSGGKT
ncbi:MAG: NAD(+)/NADH kinase [Desulfarculaceae bacterium]|nr:NAD(+)/NADH kinase [Desulfarculaceae bacterium]